MKKRMFLLFGLVLCLLLTSCNGLPATTTGEGVTTSTTTTPEKTTTVPVINAFDYNEYLFDIMITDFGELDTMRETLQSEDEEEKLYYMLRKARFGCTDIRPERFFAFIEMVENLPLLPLLKDGAVSQVRYGHQITRTSEDDPGEEGEWIFYLVKAPNGDWIEITWFLSVDDVVGEIAATVAANPEHALARPVRSADGRVTLYTQWSRPHQSKPGTYVTGLMEIDGVYGGYRLYVAPESDVNIVTQLPLLSLTDLVEKSE